MSVVVLILLGVIAAALIGWFIAFRENAGVTEQNEEVNAERSYFQSIHSLSEFPDMGFEVPKYYATKNEKVLESTLLSENGGWAIITDKAIVFETDNKNFRFPLSSISKIDIYLDGIMIWRRSGKPEKFHLQFKARFLGLAAEILDVIRRS